MSKVYALAGFSEWSSTLHYNDYADLYWGHPTDGCNAGYPYGQHCFTLIEKNRLENPLNEDLRKISIPPRSDFPIALIESGHSQYFGEGIWIIYDFKSKGNIFETENFDLALNAWEKLGFQKPKFADAFNLFDYFPETKESKAENKGDLSFYLFVFLSLISFPFIVLAMHWKFILSLVIILYFYYLLLKRFSHK